MEKNERRGERDIIIKTDDVNSNEEVPHLMWENDERVDFDLMLRHYPIQQSFCPLEILRLQIVSVSFEDCCKAWSRQVYR